MPRGKGSRERLARLGFERDQHEWLVGRHDVSVRILATQALRRLRPTFPRDTKCAHQDLAVAKASWESLYQQHPIIVGGGELPIEKLKVLPHLDRSQILGSVRYWDKGGSDDEEAAFTAGCLMHRLLDNTYVIEHIARGRWSALDRERWIKACADDDSKACMSYEVWVEQEPGSGGKESAENTIRNLAGKRVYADKVTGSKRVRAEPFAAQVQAGNVFLIAGAWVPYFRDECEAWPNSKYKDQVDAAAGAFNRLASGLMYNTNYAQWVE